MLTQRPRRLRKNAIVREMVAETRLSKDMFIYPYFVVDGKNVVHPIDAMPGINHYSVDELLKDVEKGMKVGINKILLFGVGEQKTEDASSSFSNNSIVVKATNIACPFMWRKNFYADSIIARFYSYLYGKYTFRLLFWNY